MVNSAHGTPNISSSNLCDLTNVAVDARGSLPCVCCGSLFSVGVLFEKNETTKAKKESIIRDRDRCAAIIRADSGNLIPDFKTTSTKKGKD